MFGATARNVYFLAILAIVALALYTLVPFPAAIAGVSKLRLPSIGKTPRLIIPPSFSGDPTSEIPGSFNPFSLHRLYRNTLVDEETNRFIHEALSLALDGSPCFKQNLHQVL